jgi:hypothetical protein
MTNQNLLDEHLAALAIMLGIEGFKICNMVYSTQNLIPSLKIVMNSGTKFDQVSCCVLLNPDEVPVYELMLCKNGGPVYDKDIGYSDANRFSDIGEVVDEVLRLKSIAC